MPPRLVPSTVWQWIRDSVKPCPGEFKDEPAFVVKCQLHAYQGQVSVRLPADFGSWNLVTDADKCFGRSWYA